MGRTKSSSEIISERRPASRNPFEAKARIPFSDAVHSALTRDPRPNGACLVTDLLLPDSTPVELAPEVEDGLASIDVIDRVVRVASEPEAAAGFAVEFDVSEAEDAERIIAATQRS